MVRSKLPVVCGLLAGGMVLLALTSCNGGGDPFGPDFLACIETSKARFEIPCRCDDPVDRVIRTPEEWLDAFGCRLPPVCQVPPAPETGEMLLLGFIQETGCEACLEIECVEERRNEVIVRFRGGIYDARCDALPSAAAWAIAPDRGKPVVFDEKGLDLPIDENFCP